MIEPKPIELDIQEPTSSMPYRCSFKNRGALRASQMVFLLRDSLSVPHEYTSLIHFVFNVKCLINTHSLQPNNFLI